MQKNEAPPVYSEYPTELPDRLPIGWNKVQPLVNVTELQAHLRLLGAIHKLKQDVQVQDDGIATRDEDLAWVVYVNRAVWRFYKWTSSPWMMEFPGLNERVIPPLDVIMVWHSYLLNPRAYYEDSQRMNNVYCTNLQTIQSMPLTLIASLIDAQTLAPVAPSTERQEFFEGTTSMPYYLPNAIYWSETLPTPITCPFCSAPNHLVRWVVGTDKGFAQPNFKHSCESCRLPFDRKNIGMRRFAEEIAKKRAGQKVFLSETLLDPLSGVINTVVATQFANRVLQPDAVFKLNQPIEPKDIPDQARKLATRLDYNYNTLSTLLYTAVRPKYDPAVPVKPLPRIQRLTVAYSNAGLASLDLVGSVLRQGSFIEKMVGLGWTQPNRFEYSKDLAPLVRSVARYHAFLDLMQTTGSTFCVPTLDIDLSWHSHQLKGQQYRSDTLLYIGRNPNHDDNVEAQALSIGYDITAKAWRKRFGVPYSVCGCIPDPDQESRISRFATRVSRIGIWKDKSPTLALEQFNSRPDLVSVEEDEADSSHPSEHNLQFGDPQNVLTWEKKATREMRAMKCVASAKKGAARDPWRSLQADRNENRKAEKHREAFTDPYYGYGHYYPYWGVSMAVPYGYYGGYGYGGVVGGCGTGCGATGCGGNGGGCTGYDSSGGCGGCGGCGG